jgi:hypothetical protein
VLNVDSDGTVINGIARKSRAIAENTRYLIAFVHQLRVSNLSSILTNSSSQYASISDFGNAFLLFGTIEQILHPNLFFQEQVNPKY